MNILDKFHAKDRTYLILCIGLGLYALVVAAAMVAP